MAPDRRVCRVPAIVRKDLARLIEEVDLPRTHSRWPGPDHPRHTDSRRIRIESSPLRAGTERLILALRIHAPIIRTPFH